MNRRKTGKPTVATLATIATQADFAAAVEIAKAAIADAARAPRPTSRAAVMAKLRQGEPLTESERATALRILEEPDKPRKRGRPKGSRRHAERRAIFAAVVALYPSPLNPYRNPASPHRFSQCDAIAQAMAESGFRRFSTPGAVAAEIKTIRKHSRHFIGAHFYMKALAGYARAIGEAVEQFAPAIEHIGRVVADTLEPVGIAAKRLVKSDGFRALVALAENIEAQKDNKKQ